MRILSRFFLANIFVFAFTSVQSQEVKSEFTSEAITIDGFGNETIWSKAKSQKIDQLALGKNLDSNDFRGSFKSVWDKNYLYLLVDVVDDSLSDDYKDPLDNYWNDDCVEIFIDENNGKENHQYNHNAFSYHVSIYGDVVDIGLDQSKILLNDHVSSVITNIGDHYTWELKVKVFDDLFDENQDFNLPVELTANKEMGFTLGYCDNDETKVREHFILSTVGQNDTGWLTSEKFGTIVLKPSLTTAIKDERLLSNLFPNPFENELQVSVEENATLTIVSNLGNVVFSTILKKGNNLVELDDLSSGIYIAKIYSINGVSSSVLVKNN